MCNQEAEMRSAMITFDVERFPGGYAAYPREVEGCVAAGRNRAAAAKNLRIALKLHLDAEWHRAPLRLRRVRKEGPSIVAQGEIYWPSRVRRVIERERVNLSLGSNS